MGREPLAVRAAVVAAVAALLNLAVAFGWSLTAEQIGAINTAVGLVATAAVVVWSRGSITPVDDPQDANGQPLVVEEADY
ncbi:MAG: hypothetical protein R2686_07060 [Candidatus Nanopelagicales bacterium]